jgi:tetratricopeptide (TPR) repeat protein
VVLACAACGPPTLSQPRGTAHLAALAAGGEHYHHGRMREAAAAYEEAARTAERRVDRDEARYRQAKALARADQIGDAIALLDQVAAARPASRRTARALFDAARLRLRRDAEGDRARAVADLERVAREHSDSGLASRALVHLLHERERNREPVQVTLAWLRALDPQVAASDLGDDVLVAIAEREEARGDRAAARAALERVLDEHPYPTGQRFDDACWRLADLDEADGAYGRAVEHLERLLQYVEPTRDPGSYTLPRMPASQLRVARLLRDRLGDPERAAQAFARVYESFPTSTLRDDAMLEEGELWLTRGERARGCALLQRVADENEVGSARRRAVARLAVDCRGDRE